MNLNDGSKLGMIGSGMLAIGFAIVFAVGIWTALYVFAAVAPLLTGANGAVTANSVNSTQLDLLAQQASVGLASLVLIPEIIFLVLVIIGMVLLGLALAAYGKKYGSAGMVKNGYYGAGAMVVGFFMAILFTGLIQLIFGILMIAGAVLLALGFKSLSEAANYKNLTYYGYAIVAAAVFQAIYVPLGVVVFIIVSTILFIAFRNLGKGATETNPFDTNPSAVVKTPRQPARKKKQ